MRRKPLAVAPLGPGPGSSATLGGFAVLAAAAGALAHRAVLPTNSDVAWLLTVGEKVLDGQRLYVDILETNPPASALMYLPAIMIGRLLGIAPERVLDALLIVSAAASLALAWRILAGAALIRTVSRRWLLAAAISVIFLLPNYNFGQREHVALICVLPALAAAAVRAHGRPIRRALALVAGIGLGITVSIKPHFALAALLPEVFLLARLRSLRPLFRIENFSAAAVVAAYAGALVAFFPAYLTEMLPLLRDVFLPVRYGMEALATPAMLVWAATSVWLLLAPGETRRDPLVLVTYLASAGFLGAFLVQAKGWSYQGYPSVALAFLALAEAISAEPWSQLRNAGTLRLTLRAACGLALAAFSWQSAIWFTGGREVAALASAVAVLKPRPKLIVVSADLSIGHPQVRDLGGRWVASACSQWITEGALIRQREDLREAARSRLEAHIARDMDRLAEDIRAGRPDVILIHLDWLDWRKRMTTGRLGEVFSPYQHVRTVGDVEIWSPVDRPPD
jgi:hypothetical protein